MSRLRMVLILSALVLALGACGDDTKSLSDRAQDAASDAANEAGDRVDQGVARGQAELLRERVKDIANGDTKAWPTVAVLQSAIDDLPGDPQIVGLSDNNNDGIDDDGKIEVVVDQSHACVTISGDQLDVSGDAC
jgi:hypothetical protein